MLEGKNYRGQDNNKEDEEVMNKRKKMNLVKFEITTLCNAKPMRRGTLYLFLEPMGERYRIQYLQ